MKIPPLFRDGQPVFSFEFFQPKTPQDMASFVETVRELKRLDPAFVTITYGAAGSSRERTLQTAGMIKSELGIETAAHLTCISHSRAEIAALLEHLKVLGIENIVALRGDLPKEGPLPPPEKRELPYARDLVRFIRESRHDFALAVAGYPEVHPEAASREDDLARLKAKVDAGGDWVITQLFFDNADYFDFVARARAKGVRCPIVPGIMPVTNFAQLQRFATLCGAKIPPALEEKLSRVAQDREAVVRCGVEHALDQCRDLLAKGAPGVHFYTLNKSHSTTTILSRLREET